LTIKIEKAINPIINSLIVKMVYIIAHVFSDYGITAKPGFRRNRLQAGATLLVLITEVELGEFAFESGLHDGRK